MKERDLAVNYCAGAVTALSYMAELGASKKDVFAVAGMMDLAIDDDIDQSDKERFVAAYGDLTAPESA